MFGINTSGSASSLSNRNLVRGTKSTTEIHPHTILPQSHETKPLIVPLETTIVSINEVGYPHHNIDNRTWFQRTFGKMHPGSMRGSIFSLMSSALGVGLLGLPYTVKESGVIAIIIFLITGGFITAWSMYTLAETGFKRDGIFDYPKLVANVMGKKSGQMFQLMLIFYIFGSITNNFLTGSMFLKVTLGQFGINTTNLFQIGSIKNLEILLIGLFAYPIACIRNLHGLRYTSMLGVLGICFAVLLIIFQTPSFIDQNYNSTNTNYLTIDLNIFHTFAVTTFAYAAHTNLFPIISELNQLTEKRIKTVFNRALFTEALLFMSISLCGYLSLQENTPSLIMLRPALTPTDPDILMSIVRVILTINYCLCAIPLRINPLRTQVLIILTMMKKIDVNPEHVEQPKHCIYTGILLLLPCIFAMLIPNIQEFFGIFGGTIIVLITIYYPGMLCIRSSNSNSFKVKLAKVIMVYGIFMGFTAALLTILNNLGINYQHYLSSTSPK